MLDSSHHRAKSEERRAAEHGSALQKADSASRSIHAMRGWVQPQNPGHYAPDSSGFTRNHAAYSAGRNTSVSTVPTIRPPMIEIAIDP